MTAILTVPLLHSSPRLTNVSVHAIGLGCDAGRAPAGQTGDLDAFAATLREVITPRA